MEKRSLNLETDFITDSDEPFNSDFDFFTEDEINMFFDDFITWFVEAMK